MKSFYRSIWTCGRYDADSHSAIMYNLLTGFSYFFDRVLREHDCENKIELFYSNNRKYHGWCIVLECEKAIVPLVSTIFDWDRVETIDRSITVKELMEQGWR